MNESVNVLVGLIAAVVSLGAMAASFRLWQWPYSLKSIQRLQGVGGPMVAQIYLFIVFVLMAVAAIAIFSGIRPRYAATRTSSILDHIFMPPHFHAPSLSR